MIQVSKVSKAFGENVALSQISFTVEEGTIFGFLGPSGSGKTTLIRILTNQLLSDSGESYLLGKSSRELEPADFEALGIVSDQSGFFEKLTLYKNMQAYAKFYGVGKERVDDLLQQVGLYDCRHTVAERLSTGMKQRLFLARALINRPRLLFLDEPTSGLDPATSMKIHKLLEELREQGTTIFLTTHDMAEASLLCNRIALLHRGQLVESGRPDELIRRYTTTKQLKIIDNVGNERLLTFSDVQPSDLETAFSVHSCEPNLADIFIALTGEQLHD
ncbi:MULTISPECIES: ABC transporter ATP-binding protein [unclassified Streptococcus]|uniref:ABC transporter ATP-binding protein n=1 Tax=unclassified Streptococcus TaxID=2608887 RepID=UPI00359D1098